MLKIVIGTNEGKVLCISNNENKIKESMVNYLIDTDQEPTEDFFESRNWGEYDIEVYEYHQPQLNENQEIVLDYLKEKCNLYSFIAYKPFEAIIRLSMLDPEKNELRVKNTIDELTYVQQSQVLEVFSRWALEQEAE